MHLLIGKADLARVITSVARVVEARNTIAILSNLKLTAGAGTLTVTGTDLDIVATASAPADITKPGEICVDAKLLADIAKKASGDISMSLDGDKLIVKSGRSRFTLGTLPAADFPSLDGGRYDATFDIDLAGLFAPVAFAMAVKEPNRPYLEGVYFHRVEGNAVAVATNGHRLARHVGPATEDFPSVIVGQKAVSLLPKGSVNVSVSEEKIRVQTSDLTLTSKLVYGTYPDYPRVIPMSNELVVGADKGEILKAADRVTVVSSDRGNAVKLSVASGAINLTVNSLEHGNAQDEVATDYSGEPVEIGFNSIYLRDALQVFPDGHVEIALRDSGSPARITSDGAPGLDVTLMPMRV
jgi:DNA polymerase-3 subunit beta